RKSSTIPLWVILSVGFTNICLAEDENIQEVRIVPEYVGEEGSQTSCFSSRIEAGLYSGRLSVEDFGSNLVLGIGRSSCLNRHWLFQLSYGIAEVDAAAVETSDRQFLSSSVRDFEYLSMTAGYQIVEGRSFFREHYRFGSSLYGLLGPSRIR